MVSCLRRYRAVAATGLSVPDRMPAAMDHPDVIGYDDLSADPARFQGKRVVIFGGGGCTS